MTSSKFTPKWLSALMWKEIQFSFSSIPERAVLKLISHGFIVTSLWELVWFYLNASFYHPLSTLRLIVCINGSHSQWLMFRTHWRNSHNTPSLSLMREPHRLLYSLLKRSESPEYCLRFSFKVNRLIFYKLMWFLFLWCTADFTAHRLNLS